MAHQGIHPNGGCLARHDAAPRCPNAVEAQTPSPCRATMTTPLMADVCWLLANFLEGVEILKASKAGGGETDWCSRLLWTK